MKDFKVAFPLACVWFGSTIGPAIAAGTYSTQYYITQRPLASANWTRYAEICSS